MGRTPKSQGTCSNCTKPAVEGMTRCQQCRQNNNASYKRKADRRLLQKRCVTCNEPAERWKRFCISCREQKALLAQTKANIAKKANEQSLIASGICLRCKKDACKPFRYCLDCRDYQNARIVAQNRRIKIETFNAYGGCLCSCCGENNLAFLTLDHVDNNGADHRRELFGKTNVGGSPFYRKLRKQGYPSGFRVLCFNCNVARGFFGECPHVTQMKALLLPTSD